MARYLLVTNDYPPKTGGIQVYLHELWRRFERGQAVVLTASSHPDAGAFDASSEIAVERIPNSTLFLPLVAGVSSHRGVDRAPSARAGAARSGVAARTAGPLALAALRRHPSRRRSDDPRSPSPGGVFPALRASARARGHLCGIVSRSGGPTKRGGSALSRGSSASRGRYATIRPT